MVQAIINLAAFAATLYINFKVSTPKKGVTTVGDVSHKNPTRITPANFTFAIWGVIYTLLTVFVCSHFFLDSAYYERIGFLFLVSCIFNSGWIFTWTREMYYVSQILISSLLLCLISIYVRIDVRYGSDNTKTMWETIALNAPFSMYLSWLSVANIVSIAVTIAHYVQPVRSETTRVELLGIDDQTWSIIMQYVAVALAICAAVIRRDFVFSAVITWALFGIHSKNVKIAPRVSRAARLGSGIAGVVSILTMGQIVYNSNGKWL
jgi:benzodiazapine receptor